MCTKLTKSRKVNSKWFYSFECQYCKTIFETRGDSKPKSCGCLTTYEHKVPANSNWELLEKVSNFSNKVKCRCNLCKTEYTRYPQKLINGSSLECHSCSQKKSIESEFEHCGGKRNHPLYNVWDHMIQRCTNPNNPSYEEYGGRGVTVCDEWRDSYTFMKWALENGWEKSLYIDKDKLSMELELPVPIYSPQTVCFLDPYESALYTRLSKANTSGARGVHFRRDLNKYETYFNFNGVRYRPGLCSTLEEAVNLIIVKQKEIYETQKAIL